MFRLLGIPVWPRRTTTRSARRLAVNAAAGHLTSGRSCSARSAGSGGSVRRDHSKARPLRHASGHERPTLMGRVPRHRSGAVGSLRVLLPSLRTQPGFRRRATRLVPDSCPAPSHRHSKAGTGTSATGQQFDEDLHSPRHRKTTNLVPAAPVPESPAHGSRGVFSFLDDLPRGLRKGRIGRGLGHGI